MIAVVKMFKKQLYIVYAAAFLLLVYGAQSLYRTTNSANISHKINLLIFLIKLQHAIKRV